MTNKKPDTTFLRLTYQRVRELYVAAYPHMAPDFEHIPEHKDNLEFDISYMLKELTEK